jgi:REP element-mobilizing transposase RayT
MARSPRVDIPGTWYHVTARGNERRCIFPAEADFALIKNPASDAALRSTTKKLEEAMLNVEM